MVGKKRQLIRYFGFQPTFLPSTTSAMLPLIILLLLLLGLASDLSGVHGPPDWPVTGFSGQISGSGSPGCLSGLSDDPRGLTDAMSRGPLPSLSPEDLFWLSDISDHTLINSGCSWDSNGLFHASGSSSGLSSALEWVSRSSSGPSSQS
jgi:hypothetical protein